MIKGLVIVVRQTELSEIKATPIDIKGGTPVRRLTGFIQNVSFFMREIKMLSGLIASLSHLLQKGLKDFPIFSLVRVRL